MEECAELVFPSEKAGEHADGDHRDSASSPRGPGQNGMGEAIDPAAAGAAPGVAYRADVSRLDVAFCAVHEGECGDGGCRGRKPLSERIGDAGESVCVHTESSAERAGVLLPGSGAAEAG